MQKRKRIPDKPRYRRTTQRAYQLLAELGICSFPVDPVEIIKRFPNWHLCGWMELKNSTGEKDPLYLDREDAEAKTEVIRGGSDFLIVYDERIGYDKRIRWTIAHEIGHIVLGHLIDFDKTALNRGGLTENEYKVLEAEAHYFACELLSPKTIIRRFRQLIGDANGIAALCDISYDAAVIRIKELARLDFDYYEPENAILRNFFGYLELHGLYSVNAGRLSSETIDIPEELDDYIECGYWHFVVMTVINWEKCTELKEALGTSIALCDDESMVILVRRENDRSAIEHKGDVILKCLDKYASSPVKKITVQVAALRG